jgi:hypothetical protein
MMMGPDLRSSTAELGMLKVKLAELNADEYLMSYFLSWGRILFRGSHR